MPSIELIGVNQTKPPELPELSFAVLHEPKLISHRRPSLFQRDFDGLTGWIYHLLDPYWKLPRDHGIPTAYELRSDRCEGSDSLLEFANEHRPDVVRLMDIILNLSEVSQIVFTSDYQFGPDDVFRSEPILLAKFWELHDQGQIRMNALYPINRL